MLCLITNRNEADYPLSVDQVISNKNVSLIFQYFFSGYILPAPRIPTSQSLLTWKRFVVNEKLVCSWLNALQIQSVFKPFMLKWKEQLLIRLVISEESSTPSSSSSWSSSPSLVFFSCKRQRTLNAHKFHAYLSLGPNLDRHPLSVPASAYTRVFDACQSILSHGPLSILVSINRKYFTLWLWHHVSRFPMLLGTFLFLRYILFSTMPRTMFCTLWVLSKFLLNNFIFCFLFLDSTNTKLYTRGLHSPSQWEFSGIGKSH